MTNDDEKLIFKIDDSNAITEKYTNVYKSLNMLIAHWSSNHGVGCHENNEVIF